jgi:excisionase family DNA binding protein
MKSLSEYPEIMTARNIAEYMDISYAKALHLLKYGNLPCIKIGHVFKVSRNVFEAWVNEPNKKVIA